MKVWLCIHIEQLFSAMIYNYIWLCDLSPVLIYRLEYLHSPDKGTGAAASVPDGAPFHPGGGINSGMYDWVVSNQKIHRMPYND